MSIRHIIAMGGGGFSMEPDNPLLDLYVLQQTNKRRPSVCFLPTASGDADGYVAKFYRSFENYSSDPSHLSLFRLPTSDLESYVLEKDIIYVGGGNTKSMLALWREWGLDVILRKAWEHGVVLAGLSAGSICWFEEGLTDSYGDGEILEGYAADDGVALHFVGTELERAVSSRRNSKAYSLSTHNAHLEQEVEIVFLGETPMR